MSIPVSAAQFNPSLMPTVFLPDMTKMEPFNGKNNKIWSDNMDFFLSQIGVDYCLTETEVPENSERIFEKDNKTCRGMLLHYISSPLYLIYSKHQNAKDIWEALKTKYGSDDFGTKKYACNRWLHFRMIDNKPVLDQVHEYENLCADVIAEGMKICEVFQANCLLEKLPPSWQNYVHTMKHKQKDFTLLELVSHIKIEEQNRIQSKGKQVDHSSSDANLVESKNHNRNRGPRRPNKGPNTLHGTRNPPSFKGQGQGQKQGQSQRPFKGECYNCKQTGHLAKFCPN
jgi:hypothetical protein